MRRLLLAAACLVCIPTAAALAQERSKVEGDDATERASIVEPLQPGAAEQAELTGKTVLQQLMDGNERYTTGHLTRYDVPARIARGREGQFPKAYVLSCVDSRVPVEMVFDQSVGDVFVGRVAGNVENEDQLGSMEFAAAVGGVRLLMVLGHEACGAVKGACDGVEMGNLTALLSNIQPAIQQVTGVPEADRNSKNGAFVDSVVRANVEQTLSDIRERSALLSGLEAEGKLLIVGAYYSLENGGVSLVGSDEGM